MVGGETMKDPFEHIHNATNERLAEMITSWANEMHTILMDNYGLPTASHIGEHIALLDETARRLRIPPHITFNHEYFDL